jgi:two-component system, chemotaxis family, protein-glutamate methylesterase/glutaminase
MSLAVRPVSSLAHQPIRVMVVDDAAVVRRLMAGWLAEQPDMHLVAALAGGREALEQCERLAPDVVILDIAMPDLDGLAVLPRLLAKNKNLIVLMVSTLTRRNAEIGLRALALGAADYVAKPEGSGELASSELFRRELFDKIRGLAARRRSLSPTWPLTTAPGLAVRNVASKLEGSATELSPPRARRAVRPVPPRVLLIGSSTGGPQALNAVLGGIGAVIDKAPVLITQHMPPTFTAVLAEHLARASGRPAAEAKSGESIRAGRIYVAPGGFHMRVDRRRGDPVITLDDGPRINSCKPAVDALFSSAAAVWGQWNLGLVLTGMGTDGTRGAVALVGAGGRVLVQDEASSVVWGMPGSIAQAGLASAVLPLVQIAPRVARLFAGDGS